ncbi:MAG: hypothetical protein ACHQVK_00565 [Candidatus Paceibacterales bacterium]
MTRQTLILLSCLIFTSCINNDRVEKNSQKKDTLRKVISNQIAVTSQVDTAFKLDFFSAIPDTISGCGEYFTYDTNLVTNDRYIFISNLTEFAIIKINGKDIYLKRDTIESQEINNNSYIAVYKNQNYKAVLNIKKTKSYDEGGLYSGTLQLISDKINTLFKVRGEAGC